MDNPTAESRLREIARIIEAVDQRAMAGDEDVIPTLKAMTQVEISRIYSLASQDISALRSTDRHEFTPGPWWVEDKGVRSAGAYICFTNPATHFQGQDERYEQDKVERAANKLLIAAAPDLACALEELATACEAEFCGEFTTEEPDDSKVSYPEDRCAITFGMIRRARAAIAKATGV